VQTVLRRPWHQLDVDQLRARLTASVLCQPVKWPDDIDDMAALYDSELNSVLNDLIPFRVVTRRPRSSDPWFDNDCFEAKRRTRRLERAYRAACWLQTAQHNTSSPTGVDDAKANWYAQRRSYRDLCQMKRSAFWCDHSRT